MYIVVFLQCFAYLLTVPFFLKENFQIEFVCRGLRMRIIVNISKIFPVFGVVSIKKRSALAGSHLHASGIQPHRDDFFHITET